MDDVTTYLYDYLIFGLVVHTLEGVKLVGYRWIFVQNQNKNGEIVRYKAQLVA